MRYIRNVGMALDCFLNALTGGEHNETVSQRAAREALQGKRWACKVCRWLHYTVERDHCAKTLDPSAPTKTAACIRALLQMLALVWCVVHLYGWWVWG